LTPEVDFSLDETINDSNDDTEKEKPYLSDNGWF